MIFINFAENPRSFDVIENGLGPYIQPLRLDKAKVAHRQSYKIKSNWKFAVENYKECYHCGPAHPEYSRAHSLALPEEKYEPEYQALLEKMPSLAIAALASRALFNHILMNKDSKCLAALSRPSASSRILLGSFAYSVYDQSADVMGCIR